MTGVERVLWRLVLVLLVVGAVLSVWAALGGRLTPSQAKMLAWSWGVALYTAMGLGCAAVVQRQPTSLGARAGLGFALAAALLFTLGIWTGAARALWWWKAFGSTSVLALATVHASLLLLVDVGPRFAPIRALTRMASYLCAGLLTLMMLIERGDDVLFRIVGVSATVAAFGTLAMPVLWKLSRNDAE